MKNTKKALLLSVMSLLLCVSMLVGTTFAWFTDSVSTGKNTIAAGNLDIELEYSKTMEDGSWVQVDENTNVFDSTKWEPGHTDVVYLRVSNVGSLALKYKLGINVADETIGKTKDGNDIKLSDYIEYGIATDVTAKYADRTAARAAITTATKLNTAYSEEFHLVGKTATATDTDVFALVVYMPESVDNAANHNGTDIPVINLGLSVIATQDTVESDSFNNQYDKDATYSGVVIPADAVRVTTYRELSDALTSGGNIALAADIEVTSSLDITKDVDLYAVEGTKLSFASTAQMKVKNGATLDLMNVTVDNGDTFGFDADGKFQIADVAGRNTAAIFDVSAGSQLTIEKATTISNVVGKNQAVVMAKGTAESRATVTVKGTIKNCAGTTGGVICADKCADVYIEDGAVLKENVSYNSHNYGLIKIYDGSMFYMNGGEITKNLYAGNGLIGFQSANAIMNGGIIHNNNYYDGHDSIIDSGNTINSRHGLIYAHSNSEFVITGGEIINNTVTWFGALDCMRKNTVTLVVEGGTVKNNLSREVFYSEDTGEEYAIGTEFFGTITSEDHITLSKDADVSGLIQDFSAGDDIYKDVTTLAK